MTETRTSWKHLVFVDRKKQGRDWHNTYTGFSSLEEIAEFERYQKEHNYVYFPYITERYEKDGQFYCTLKVADSCD
jgi:hypothetical protein